MSVVGICLVSSPCQESVVSVDGWEMQLGATHSDVVLSHSFIQICRRILDYKID